MKSTIFRASTAPHSPRGRKRATGVAAALATIAVAGLVLGGTTSASAATDNLITADDLANTSYAAAGQTTWLTDNSDGGTATITTDGLDARSAIKMDVAKAGASGVAGSQVQVFKSYGTGVRPTNVASLLAGSSFSYSGNDVTFQLAMFYTPNDETHYGPTAPVGAGNLPCTPASDGGVTLPGMCFTVIKFDPRVASSDSYATTALADQQQPYFKPNSGGDEPGWWNTKSIGSLNANASATLDQMLGQMQDYQIYAVGASVGGTGATVGDSWLLNLTFGGDSYSFGTAPTPVPPTAPPVADSTALDQIIASGDVDVAADVANFSPGTDSNSDLAAVDPSKPLSGTYAWQDPTDAFVDVYTYSDPIFVGTFPVVNGNVVFTAAALAQLGAGDHHLVLTGETSGTLGVIPFTILAATGNSVTLAFTGVTNVVPIVTIGALLLIVGLGVLLIARRRVRRRS